MDALDDILINNILRTDHVGKVLQGEDDRIEYKESFDNGSKDAKAKYAKEMAALHNYKGGYLIFGVKDGTLELTGLNNFTPPDNAELVNDINVYFSPAIRFKTRLVNTNGKVVFVIYVEERKSIPTVCIRGHQDTLKESTIYWRYTAKSAPINSGDLINLLNGLKGEGSKELVEVAKREYRSKFKPRLRSSTATSGDEFGIHIENEGGDAIVDKFYVTESSIDKGKVFLYQWNQPVTIRKSGSIKITGNSPISASQLAFKMKMEYRDIEGHKYQTTISWERGRSKMDEPTFVEEYE
jgi:hypothetical protein